MEKTYEFKGKNVEQALELASDDLNLPVEKIKHEVLAYGSSGIFGLVGVKKAIIKVLVDEGKENHGTKPQNGDNPPKTHQIKNIDVDSGKKTGDSSIDVEAMSNYGKECLQKIVDEITTGATVDLSLKKETLFFSLIGGDSGVLIGKRGQTLEAIQYLLEKMINKKSVHRVRVVVDVEGYIEKRKLNLQQMASRMAEKAKKTRKPVTIGQMNAHDRRIVHIHLKDNRSVRTQSIGDGYFRKLMIFPKKQGGSKKRNNQEQA